MTEELKPCPFCGSNKLKIQGTQRKIGATGTDEPVARETYSVRCNGRFFFLGNMTRESTTKFKEIFSLRRALKFAGIPHKFKDESIRIIKGETNFLMIEKYHILYPQNPFILSAVEGDGTYGADSDKIEIMGLLTEEEAKTDRVVGWLDADDVFRRIKEHWESVKIE